MHERVGRSASARHQPEPTFSLDEGPEGDHVGAAPDLCP